MFEKVTTFHRLASRRAVPALRPFAPANDNRANLRPSGTRQGRQGPRLICRWSLNAATNRPTCRWELDTSDEPNPGLCHDMGSGGIHTNVFELSYRKRLAGAALDEPRLKRIPLALAQKERACRQRACVAHTSLEDAI